MLIIEREERKKRKKKRETRQSRNQQNLKIVDGQEELEIEVFMKSEDFGFLYQFWDGIIKVLELSGK